MKLRIAETIRSLRKEMGITQEELARAICVTTQAVSKWERDEGYPDITLLPVMAEFFHVTLDTLCGIDEQQKQAEISAILKATASSYEESVQIAREGLARFPHSDLLKHNLASALMGCPARWTPPREVAEEVIGLYEDILRHNPNLHDIASDALPQLCLAYMSVGEQQKAEQIAYQMEGQYERQRLWCQILTGEELVNHVQESIIHTLPGIHFMVRELLKTSGYTAKEKIALCEKMIGVYGLLYEGDDWLIGLMFSEQLYVQIAVLSLSLRDTSGCLTALDKAAELAIRQDSLPSEGPIASLLLNRSDFRYFYGPRPERESLRKDIEEEAAFESIRTTPEYARIMEKL